MSTFFKDLGGLDPNFETLKHLLKVQENLLFGKMMKDDSSIIIQLLRGKSSAFVETFLPYVERLGCGTCPFA